MPWRQMSPMDQRTQFIADHLRHTLLIRDSLIYGQKDIELRSRQAKQSAVLRAGPAHLGHCLHLVPG